MGLELWEIYASLGLDTSKYDSAIDAAIAKAEKLNSTLSQTPTTGGSSGGTTGSGEPSNPVGDTAKGVALGTTLVNIGKKVVSAASDIFLDSIEAASNKKEVQNVVDVTFGSYADAVNSWANNATTGFGLNPTTAKDYAGRLGDMLTAAGFEGEEMFTMATKLTERAADIASFRNEDFDTAFNRLYSGMTGQVASMRKYGVDMTVANMEDYSGLDWSFATSKEKYRTRYDYILAQTSNAEGDFRRTLDDSFANQQRVLAENIEILETQIGNNAMKAITTVMASVNNILSPEKTVDALFAEYDAAAATAKANSQYQASKATALVQMMEAYQYQGKDTLGNSDWIATISKFAETMPTLSTYIDAAAGTLAVSTDELQTMVDAWLADAEKAADVSAQIGKAGVLETKQMELSEMSVARSLAAVTDRSGLEQAALQVASQLQAQIKERGGYAGWAMGLTDYSNSYAAASMLPAVYENLRLNGKISSEDAAADAQLLGLLNSYISQYDEATNALKTWEEEGASLRDEIERGKEAFNLYNESMNDTVSVTENAVRDMDKSANAYRAGFNTGSAYHSGFENGLGSLPNVNVQNDDGVDGSHKAGLNYVPYDGYIAELHRGERVLPANEAAAWKNEAGDLDSLKHAVCEAVRDGIAGIAVNMDSRTVGQLVAPTVSREIAIEARARRYNP